MFIKSKKNYFKREYSWIDIVFIIMNVMLYDIYYTQNYDEMTDEEFESHMKSTRYFMVAGTILVFLRLSYFFRIIDAIAPLYDIIIQIVYDIKYLFLIVMLFIVAFSMSFFYLGQN